MKAKSKPTKNEEIEEMKGLFREVSGFNILEVYMVMLSS